VVGIRGIAVGPHVLLAANSLCHRGWRVPGRGKDERTQLLCPLRRGYFSAPVTAVLADENP
jgi:hypothetical protein